MTFQIRVLLEVVGLKHKEPAPADHTVVEKQFTK